MKKIKFEKMLEIFEKTSTICTKENMQKWNEQLEKHGWTDEEFDAELSNRIYGRKIA